MVLGTQSFSKEDYKLKIGDSEYSEMIQAKCKNVNMNAMPQLFSGNQMNQYTFRLDLPNVQINSEELINHIDTKNEKVYKMPVRNKFDHVDKEVEEVPKPLKVHEQPPKQEPIQLGKRAKPDNEEEEIDFDMDDIEQEVEKIKDDVKQKNLQSEPYKR